MAENDLHDAAFPRLNEEQIAALGQCAGAELKRYRDGETLIKAGDREYKFFVLRSGEIEILDEAGETPKTLARLGPGEFSGDIGHLTGGPSLITAVARGDCE